MLEPCPNADHRRPGPRRVPECSRSAAQRERSREALRTDKRKAPTPSARTHCSWPCVEQCRLMRRLRCMAQGMSAATEGRARKSKTTAIASRSTWRGQNATRRRAVCTATITCRKVPKAKRKAANLGHTRRLRTRTASRHNSARRDKSRGRGTVDAMQTACKTPHCAPRPCEQETFDWESGTALLADSALCRYRLSRRLALRCTVLRVAAWLPVVLWGWCRALHR